MIDDRWQEKFLLPQAGNFIRSVSHDRVLIDFQARIRVAIS